MPFLFTRIGGRQSREAVHKNLLKGPMDSPDINLTHSRTEHISASRKDLWTTRSRSVAIAHTSPWLKFHQATTFKS